jgi:hypothetical protein
MDESGKKAMGSQESTLEQLKAAQRQTYDEASQAVYKVRTLKPLAGEPVTQADLDEIHRHYGNLSNIRPELMDQRFTDEVEALKRDCKELLDAPIGNLFKE